MARIVIKDLPENTELDRQAMLAIAGGSRLRAAGTLLRTAPRRIRLYDLSSNTATKAGPARNKPA